MITTFNCYSKDLSDTGIIEAWYGLYQNILKVKPNFNKIDWRQIPTYHRLDNAHGFICRIDIK